MGHPPTGPFAPLAAEEYLLLTTFRRTGEAVPTPVWVAADGEALLVTTMAHAGKVKRIKHDPHVTVQGCDRTGGEVHGALLHGEAYVSDDDEISDRTRAILKRKYGWKFGAATTIDRLRPHVSRVSIRIVPADLPPDATD